MAQINETGHGINVSNFKLQIDTNASFGATYAPSNNALKTTAMMAQWTAAKGLHTGLGTALENSKIPINEREILFAPLTKKITRVFAFVKSTSVSKQFVADVKGLADVIRGRNVKVKKLADGTPDPTDVSKSHLSYVMRAENYKLLLDLLATTALYAPSEVELQLTTLTAEHTAMEALNNNIGVIIAPVNQARIARNEALYNETTGVVAIALASKNYVKALFGAGSAEYKLVSGIKYTKVKI